MNSFWQISLGQVLTMITIISSMCTGVWAVRGWVEKQTEGMKARHRQNTARLDFMLALINQERADLGLREVPCPYRRIIDD